MFLGFRGQGLQLGVPGSVEGSGLRVQGLGFGVSLFGSAEAEIAGP